eukprot:TRINITY_DN6198_c0_g1_i2.p2 TRINITY_DN6198_c0_g1~~TRINITY_DN6198_c0_g1_i2.p2  ORF type:complete len:156 (+),score=43.82 TRINITY_DN6198_c0_g1_i2:633-1100(+)
MPSKEQTNNNNEEGSSLTQERQVMKERPCQPRVQFCQFYPDTSKDTCAEVHRWRLTCSSGVVSVSTPRHLMSTAMFSFFLQAMATTLSVRFGLSIVATHSYTSSNTMMASLSVEIPVAAPGSAADRILQVLQRNTAGGHFKQEHEHTLETCFYSQ